ncbi:MAG: hypothetical protein WCW68_03725 [Methanothrix sp.]
MSNPFDIQKFEEILSLERETLEGAINETHDNLKSILKSDNYVLAEELKISLLNLGKLYDLTDTAKIGKAIDVLSNEDPLKYLMEYYQTRHSGDLKLGKIIFIAIANQSILNSEGIQPHLGGRSGTGKTHAAKTVVAIIPDMPYKKEGSLSAKSLYYQKDLPDGLIFFSDDIKISPDLEDTLKRSMSNFQENTIHNTVINGAAGTLELPKRIMWLLTSVAIDGSDELRNRLYQQNVDESCMQDENVAKMQLEEACHVERYDGLEDIKIICQLIIYIIKKQLFEVDVPYSKSILPSKHVTKDRRRLPRFIDMIKGIALFNFMQRQFDDRGRLIATLDDFYEAKELFEANIESQVTNLTPAELRLAKWLFEKAKSVSINDIVNEYLKPDGTQFNPESIRKTLQGTKTREGLIAKLPGLLVDETKREVKYLLPNLEIFEGELITLEKENATSETPNLSHSCVALEKLEQEA